MEEIERIECVDMNKGNQGAAYRDILVWCMNVVADASKKNLISEMMAADFLNDINHFRGSLEQCWRSTISLLLSS